MSEMGAIRTIYRSEMPRGVTSKCSQTRVARGGKRVTWLVALLAFPSAPTAGVVLFRYEPYLNNRIMPYATLPSRSLPCPSWYLHSITEGCISSSPAGPLSRIQVWPANRPSWTPNLMDGQSPQSTPTTPDPALWLRFFSAGRGRSPRRRCRNGGSCLLGI